MTSRSDVVVEAEGLAKHYGRSVAIERLDLELRRGEVFGFLGPNGAGKTTTVKLLLGLVRPTSGTVRLFGEPVAANAANLLRRVGAIVEAPAFYPYMSGRDNLRTLATMAGIPIAKVDAAIETVGLQRAARHKFGAYSMGMKQRLGLASVLLRDPELVILDEPTSGLDPAGQREVDAILPRLAAEGRTVFFSSHSMPEVQRVCHRVAIMNAGRLVAAGSVRELLGSDEALELRVPDHAVAARVLGNLEWVEGVERDGDYLVVLAPLNRAGDVTAALAGAGIFLTELRPRSRSLESVYFKALGQEAA